MSRLEKRQLATYVTLHLLQAWVVREVLVRICSSLCSIERMFSHYAAAHLASEALGIKFAWALTEIRAFVYTEVLPASKELRGGLEELCGGVGQDAVPDHCGNYSFGTLECVHEA